MRHTVNNVELALTHNIGVIHTLYIYKLTIPMLMKNGYIFKIPSSMLIFVTEFVILGKNRPSFEVSQWVGKWFLAFS